MQPGLEICSGPQGIRMVLIVGKDTETDHVAVLQGLYVRVLIGYNEGCHVKSNQRHFNFIYKCFDIDWFLNVINGSHFKGFLNIHNVCNS